MIPQEKISRYLKKHELLKQKSVSNYILVGYGKLVLRL